jgi:hypothetical protein
MVRQGYGSGDGFLDHLVVIQASPDFSNVMARNPVLPLCGRGLELRRLYCSVGCGGWLLARRCLILWQAWSAAQWRRPAALCSGDIEGWFASCRIRWASFWRSWGDIGERGLALNSWAVRSGRMDSIVRPRRLRGKMAAVHVKKPVPGV